jgi:positive regulator of sigma E activity
MAKKKAWVADVNRNGWAQVVIDRGDACNHCEASQLCHSISMGENLCYPRNPY